MDEQLLYLRRTLLYPPPFHLLQNHHDSFPPRLLPAISHFTAVDDVIINLMPPSVGREKDNRARDRPPSSAAGATGGTVRLESDDAAADDESREYYIDYTDDVEDGSDVIDSAGDDDISAAAGAGAGRDRGGDAFSGNNYRKRYHGNNPSAR